MVSGTSPNVSRLAIRAIGVGLAVGACLGWLIWAQGAGLGMLLSQSTSGSVVATARVHRPNEPGDARFARDGDEAINDPLTASPDTASIFAWRDRAFYLVDELGSDAQAIERVAASLPVSQAQAFRVTAAERLAASDVPSAIEFALTLQPRVARTIALQRIADVSARTAPRAALEHATLVFPHEMRSAYRERILDAWASVDALGILEYIEHANASELNIAPDALRALAAASPEQLLAVVDRFPPDVRLDSLQAAMDALIATDPISAYEYASAMPFGHDRDRLLQLIVSAYGQQHPKEALSLLLAVERPPLGVVNAALQRVASEDLLYAVEVAAESLLSGETYGAFDRLAATVSAALDRSTADVAAALDLIAHHHDPRVRAQLNGNSSSSSVFGAWAENDPEGAFAWALRNSSHVAPDLVTDLASRLAASAPSRATAALYDLPADLRGYWLVGVANGLASSSLEDALQWLDSARGSPAYATGLDSALNVAASTDPVAAARVVEDIPNPSASIVAGIARAWGSREPEAAGDWIAALGSIDEHARSQALGDIVAAWSEGDLSAAERWTMNQPAGSLRDSALDAMMWVVAKSGSVDVGLLQEYSSDRARDLALVGAMSEFRRSDPELGRWLIDQYITDPELRDSAQQRLDGRTQPPFRRVDGQVIRR